MKRIMKSALLVFCSVVLIITIVPRGRVAAQNCTGPDEFDVSYSAWIPEDHLSGPFGCSGVAGWHQYVYAGDALVDPSALFNTAPPGYRVQSSISLFPGESGYWGLLSDTGETLQFAYPTPVNGSYLSAIDNNDGQAENCWLFTGAGFSSGGTTSYNVQLGDNTETLSMIGNAADPLESQAVKGIQWNLAVTVNYNPAQYPNGAVTVQGNVTCYPSSKVVVNYTPVAVYNAPRNPGLGTLSLCLAAGWTEPIQGIANVQAF